MGTIHLRPLRGQQIRKRLHPPKRHPQPLPGLEDEDIVEGLEVVGGRSLRSKPKDQQLNNQTTKQLNH